MQASILMTLIAALLLCSQLQQTVVAKEQYHEFVVITSIDHRTNCFEHIGRI
jgi:hypothetical protein